MSFKHKIIYIFSNFQLTFNSISSFMSFASITIDLNCQRQDLSFYNSIIIINFKRLTDLTEMNFKIVR